MRPDIIERALQIARAGQCKSIEAIAKKLGEEGYDAAHAHLPGKQTREKLNALSREAKRAAQAPPPPTEA